jgi:hypothetical protein
MMRTKLVIGIIAIAAVMLALSSIEANQASAKSVSTCTNNGGQTSTGPCQGNLDSNNKCQTTHAGNSENSAVKSQTGSGC